jgi:hypothetical protein
MKRAVHSTCERAAADGGGAPQPVPQQSRMAAHITARVCASLPTRGA